MYIVIIINIIIMAISIKKKNASRSKSRSKSRKNISKSKNILKGGYSNNNNPNTKKINITDVKETNTHVSTNPINNPVNTEKNNTTDVTASNNTNVSQHSVKRPVNTKKYNYFSKIGNTFIKGKNKFTRAVKNHRLAKQANAEKRRLAKQANAEAKAEKERHEAQAYAEAKAKKERIEKEENEFIALETKAKAKFNETRDKTQDKDTHDEALALEKAWCNHVGFFTKGVEEMNSNEFSREYTRYCYETDKTAYKNKVLPII